MRLKRRSFRAAISVTSGSAPIIFHFGLVSFEATLSEARQLAVSLVDAIERAQAGGEVQ